MWVPQKKNYKKKHFDVKNRLNVFTKAAFYFLYQKLMLTY